MQVTNMISYTYRDTSLYACVRNKTYNVVSLYSINRFINVYSLYVHASIQMYHGHMPIFVTFGQLNLKICQHVW